MALYLHDGSVGGQATWTEAALTAGVADGAVMSPFFTPQVPRPRNPSGEDYADRIRGAHGEVIFDATTHAVTLPGVDNWANYRTWSLWGGPRGDLSTPALVQEHVARVFDHQTALGAPHLTPTLTLDNPIGPSADSAVELAEEGRAQDPDASQSLSGRRGFWLSPDLDAYVGSLVSLRAPTWFVTVVRDTMDYPPDMSDLRQTAAVCRTIQTLARRSRVVLCQSDLFGLPGVAAGADSVGSGWHTKQRVCCPATYQQNDPTQVRRQAEWHTFEGLAARLHNSVSDILQRNDATRANSLYRGTVSSATADLRHHHLGAVRALVATVDSAGRSPADRVQALRDIYEFSISELDDFTRRYSRLFQQVRGQHIDSPMGGLEAYARAEGIWT
jgi:hypothetical protein